MLVSHHYCLFNCVGNGFRNLSQSLRRDDLVNSQLESMQSAFTPSLSSHCPHLEKEATLKQGLGSAPNLQCQQFTVMLRAHI